VTRLFRSKSVHWKITNSTTLTFATRVACLRADYKTYKKFCGGGRSKDFAMFTALRKRHLFTKGRTLVSSVPSVSTHVHLPWISPNPEIDAASQRMCDSDG
jgi:hypothetical protein